MMDRPSMRLLGWALAVCAIFYAGGAVIGFRLLLSVNDFYPSWKPTVSGTVLMLGAMVLSAASAHVLGSRRLPV